MSNDDHSEETDLSQANGSDDSQGSADDSQQDTGNNGQQDSNQGNSQDSGQQDSSQDDTYRGKLNATNRFLQKEGYEFRDGNWHRKVASASAGQQNSQEQAPVQNALSRDEAILIAKGLSVEEVEHAQKVAALQGTPLLEAVNDDLFTTWKSKRDDAVKDQRAQLGASRGGRSNVTKTFNTPGLSDDDHREMFNDKIGK
jgi:hypothetical protein